MDLAQQAVTDAFGSFTEIRVLALAAATFHDIEGVLQYPPTGDGLIGKALGSMRLIASTSMKNADLAGIGWARSERPDLVVGVGGGYLRTDGGARSLKTLVAHGLQMRWLLSLGVPTYYLPQSVGPLADRSGRMIKRWLANIDRINVRDDRSVHLLSGNFNVRRRPDLAVSSIARELTGALLPEGIAKGCPRLIARHLQRNNRTSANYQEKLKRLVQKIPKLQPALQSSGRGNDDPSFYQTMGWDQNAPFLRDLIASESRPAFVISVRLHGALEAIRAGIPAIHLSYERKGFGAYDDLGVPEFVHNANSFDLDLVINQAQELEKDPSVFWKKVQSRVPQIERDYADMIADLREIAAVRLS